MNLHFAGNIEPGLSWVSYVVHKVLQDDRKPNILESYFYCDIKNSVKGKERWISNYHKTKELCNWIMDSGIFTMILGAEKDRNYSDTEIINYTKQYLKFLKDIDYQHTFVEVDAHKINGVKFVHQLRELILEQYNADQCIFVWHTEEGIDGLIEMANKYPYIALGCVALAREARSLGENAYNLIRRLLNLIKANTERLPKIHLLGCASPRTLQLPFYYSADTTSWLAGIRFYKRMVFFINGQLTNGSMYSDTYKEYLESQLPSINNAIDDSVKVFPHLKERIDKVRDNRRILNAVMCGIEYLKLSHYINRRYHAESLCRT